LKKNNVGLFTTLYFYTYSGWRFKAETWYNWSSSGQYNYEYQGYGNAPIITEFDQKAVSKGFQVNIGVRKQFNLAIPKKMAKRRFCNARFVAFLDINGNKIMDPDEVPLENVVVKLNENEALTNKSGEATFVNAAWGDYDLEVFSLVDLGAWFPVAPDSVNICNLGTHYIPFSKGINIQGSVEMQREKYSGQMFENLDLSRIKIVLTDSTGRAAAVSLTNNKGEFSFYVPYGNYILSMDEKVLGSTFSTVQNNIIIDLQDGMDNFYYTFVILENKRKVVKKKFDDKGKLVEVRDELAEGDAGRNKQLAMADVRALVGKIDSMANVLYNDGNAGFYTYNNSNGEFTPYTPPGKNKKELLYTVELAHIPAGGGAFKGFCNSVPGINASKQSKEVEMLLEMLKTGSLMWYYYPDGGTSLVYGIDGMRIEAFTSKNELDKVASKTEVKAIYQNKLITLTEADKLK
jgi:hypothetical protein